MAKGERLVIRLDSPSLATGYPPRATGRLTLTGVIGDGRPASPLPLPCSVNVRDPDLPRTSVLYVGRQRPLAAGATRW